MTALFTVLVIAQAGLAVGAGTVTAILSAVVWGGALAGVGIVLAAFVRYARGVHRARLLTEVQTILNDERSQHQSLVDDREAERRREQVTQDARHAKELADARAALLSTWSPAQAIVLFHRAEPRVSSDGRVTVLLAAQNRSPYRLRLEDSAITPFVDDRLAEKDRMMSPSSPEIEPGTIVDLTIVGILETPPIAGALVKVFVGNRVTAVRIDDGVRELVGVVRDSGGDCALTVKVGA